ncbi:MAG TPA: ABC transporter ATP-binding protein [Nocardioidaceae bacterium]|jgi:putative ABC transport system ATP-binding protein|nr:ABC transporter ATP-binding protein [Nocardioidaceae bacterium]
MTTTSTATRIGARIEAIDLTRRYRVHADADIIGVNSISFTIDAGTVVALTGPSGSGKSTLLHLLGAIDRPDAGSLTVDDLDLARLSRRRLAEYRRSIGFVFQRFNLLPALTALDNVLAPVLPYRTDYDKRARAVELLDRVGLAGREKSLPTRMSGGQQQRVAIARALMNSPRLLLADEPTGNLDSATGDDVLRLLFDLQRATGMTIVIATHDPNIAARSDHRLHIHDGQLANMPRDAAGSEGP